MVCLVYLSGGRLSMTLLQRGLEVWRNAHEVGKSLNSNGDDDHEIQS